ncbi:hypothetical protein Pd630_LPD03059 [Rhodococcus opacus PD630]|nr:hypothetical protein Pd630_LPD03059 [Rhodococcus opacus PD630]
MVVSSPRLLTRWWCGNGWCADPVVDLSSSLPLEVSGFRIPRGQVELRRVGVAR